MEELQKKIQMKVSLYRATLRPHQPPHRNSQFPIWPLVSGFFHSMMRAAVGIWSKLSRGRRRLLSSAVVDMPTRTTPPNWHHMSARNTAPCAALWYVQVHPVSLGAYWCPLLNRLQLYNDMLRVTSFYLLLFFCTYGLVEDWLVHSGIWYWPYFFKNNVNSQAKRLANSTTSQL